jgi:Protein of unknown function (DUF1173)
MSIYRIGAATVSEGDPRLEQLLTDAKKDKQRPLCLCVTPHPEMYIAKVGGKHILKRMPGSGAMHSTACDSFEPPPELSGLGQVMGSAIQENLEDGQTTLKLAFSMSKAAGRAAPVASGRETETVKTDGNKLSLRGLLHLLWEQAGLVRWSPRMEGKRSWYVVRKYLLQATEDKLAKGVPLAGLVYVPETFKQEDADAIDQRRIAAMTHAATTGTAGKQLMVVVGQIVDLSTSRFGYKVTLKHLPDFHFMLNEDIYRRLEKRFEMELGIWSAFEDINLMLIGTFSVNVTGVAHIEELAVMPTTSNWIPFDTVYDKKLIESMSSAGRRFIKGLRYNLPSTTPLACLVTTDTEKSVAMYIKHPGASEEYIKALNTLQEESELECWQWEAGAAIPEFPIPKQLSQAKPNNEPT